MGLDQEFFNTFAKLKSDRKNKSMFKVDVGYRRKSSDRSKFYTQPE